MIEDEKAHIPSRLASLATLQQAVYMTATLLSEPQPYDYTCILRRVHIWYKIVAQPLLQCAADQKFLGKPLYTMGTRAGSYTVRKVNEKVSDNGASLFCCCCPQRQSSSTQRALTVTDNQLLHTSSDESSDGFGPQTRTMS
jgi:hypothetical protein